MTDAVTLSTSDGPKDVSAVLSLHLAVHRVYVGSGWAVTHRPTGLAIAFVDTRREGLALTERLERDNAADLAALSKLKFGKMVSSRGKNGAAAKRLRAAIFGRTA